jgi:hypothetical protein
MNSTDLLTKLLANENLTILRENVPTASFDIMNRVLRLPVFLNMNPSEEFMMSLHEVGHALYTDESYVDYIKNEKGSRKNFGSYMNVLEDARIERMIKDYYTGVRKDFFSGYSSLNERDFFGISGKDVNSMHLIDRINVYFKVGIRSGVRFSERERELVYLAERTKTLQEVYQLAIKVYDMALEQANAEAQRRFEMSEEDIFDGSDEEDFDINGEGDDEFNTDDYDESEEGEDDEERPSTFDRNTRSNEKSEGKSDDAPESETQSHFDSSVKQNVQGPGQVHYLVPGTFGKVVETSYKQLIADYEEEVAAEEMEFKKYYENLADTYKAMYGDQLLMNRRYRSPEAEEAYKKFRIENNKAVAHLFKEFEMRKAARRYTRTQVSASGSLNVRKIHNYRTSGDIFAAVESVLDEKNHSFLMLLDWSGSMSENLRDSIGQVITLASFCRRAKIPFKVLGFRSLSFAEHKDLEPTVKMDGYNGVNTSDNINLFTLFDSKMNSSEFDKVAHFAYTGYLIRTRKYDLTGTPLIASLSQIYNYIPTFQKFANTEKTTLILVSDGDSNDSSMVSKDGVHINRWSNSPIFIRCKYTGKVYNYPRYTNEQLHTIMLMIDNAFPTVSRVGFFIADPSSRSAILEFNRIYHSMLDNSVIRKSMRERGFCEYPSKAYDKLFVIPASSDSSSVDLSNITKDMTPAQISKKMSGAMTRAVNSRVVLTRFIEAIS